MDRLWETSEVAKPPPAVPAQQFMWGLAQPLLGMRTVLGDRRLLLQSVVPVVGMLILAGLIALYGGMDEAPELGGGTVTLDSGLGPAKALDGEALSSRLSSTWWGFLWRLWAAIVVLSPLPSLFFAPFYARIAARGHERLGLGAVAPYKKTAWQSFKESFRMALTIGFSPLGIIPIAGAFFTGLWSVHWAVAEGLDNGRVLPIGVAQPDELEIGKAWPHEPWFIRALDWIDEPSERHSVPMLFARLFGRLVRLIAKLARNLGRPWRSEVEVIEVMPWASGGFGIGVVVLLAIPGLNLLFRSACAVGATNFRRQLVSKAFAEGHWPLDNPAASGVATFEPLGERWQQQHLPSLEVGPSTPAPAMTPSTPAPPATPATPPGSG